MCNILCSMFVYTFYEAVKKHMLEYKWLELLQCMEKELQYSTFK